MHKLKPLLIFLLAFVACTKNEQARRYGGTITVNLLPGERFINIAWKGDDLWVVTEDTTSHTCFAVKKSSYGLVEGKNYH